jgi:hypothetical protein
MADTPSPDATPAARSIGSGAARLRKRRGRRDRLGLKPVWLIAAILVVFGAGFVLSGGGAAFLQNLYSPVAVIIAIFLMIEYIVLKGRGRSHIYHLELDQLRQRRHEEIEFLRDLEEELHRIEKDLERLSVAAPGATDSLPASLQEVREFTKRVVAVRGNLSRRF